MVGGNKFAILLPYYRRKDTFGKVLNVCSRVKGNLLYSNEVQEESKDPRKYHGDRLLFA